MAARRKKDTRLSHKDRIAQATRDGRARQVYIFKLRDNLTNEEIAEKLNIEPWQVKKDLERAYRVLQKEIIADAEQATNTHLLRLAEMADRLRAKAFGPNGSVDVQAAREYRACLESERKLRGLDKQKERIELSGPGGAPVKVQAVESEIVRRFEERKRLLTSRNDKPIDVPAKEI
jgi:hypothetical protein